MSGVNNQMAPPVARADEIKIRAAAWLEQRDSGDWSDQDRAQFDEWLSASADHRVEFLRVQAAWDRAERLAVLRSTDVGPEANSGTRRIWMRLLSAVASVAVLALVAGGIAAYLSSARYTAYATTVGGHETLTLDDRTQIELNTDTAIRILENKKERKVILDRGEAYFQVTHDAARAFVVLAGSGSVTDLGTKFLIRRDPARLEVAVMEGRARFDPSNIGPRARSAVLVPGDVAVTTADTVAVRKAPPQALNNALGWRRGMLVFENATLADAAAELNRYNHEKLIIADAAAARLTFGATLPTTDVEAFTDVAKDVLGLRVEKRGGQIVISR
jgi:transmembrane sensor